MKKKFIIGAAVSILIILIIVANVIGGGSNKSNIKVKAAIVKKDTVAGTVSVSGKVDLMARTEVRASIAGALKELKYALGDRVGKNAVVAVIENKDLQEQQKQAKDAYDTAVKKYNDLKNKAVTVNAPATPAQQAAASGDAAALSAADAEVKTTKATLDKMNSQLDQLNIKAPGEGTVLYSSYRPGQQVGPEQPLVVLGDLNNLMIRAKVSEMDLLKLAKGQEVKITSDAVPDKTYKGEVYEISQLDNSGSISQISGAVTGGQTGSSGSGQSEATYDVIIKVVDKDTQLRPGFNVNADITLQKKDKTLAVPVEAVLDLDFGSVSAMGFGQSPTDDNQDASVNEKKVFVLGKDNTVEERKVKTGITGDTVVEILDGLKDGDKVILSPDEKTVRPGIKVSAE